jgi:HSP20 family protein
MAEARQQQNVPQPQEQQSTQENQPHGGGQQTGIAPRGGGLQSLFTLNTGDLLRTSPFALMRRFSEEMDHWFTQLGRGRGGQGLAEASGGLFAPPVEVFERAGHLVVRADLPGLTKDNVRVEVTDNALLLEGERRSEHEEHQGGTFHSERHYGIFRRQIPLPDGVKTEQTTATFKDGVLEITIPAPERPARGRRIDIQGASSSSATQAVRGSASPTASRTDHDDAQPPEQSAS